MSEQAVEPIRVKCIGCGKSLKAPAKLAGRTAPCPNCGTQVAIPRIARDASESLIRPLIVPAVPPAEPDIYATRDEPEATRPATIQPALVSPPPQRAKRPAPRKLPAPSIRPESGVAPAWARWVYLLFALALIPLVASLLGDDDAIEQRLAKTLESQPDLAARVENDEIDIEQLFSALPDHRITGAHLPRDTWLHWLYGVLASVAFMGMLVGLFERGNARVAHLLGVGLATATGGIFFLLAVQWIAAYSAALPFYGRGIIALLLLIVKFIGFSYSAALNPEYGFLLSFVGFTCGVGLCEELTKALPVMFRFHMDDPPDWPCALLWGLASGIGFGIAEGIMYSSQHYNGICTGDIYTVRFLSCVALHSVWSGAAAVAIWRRRDWLENEFDLGAYATSLAWVLGVPIVLHGLYDTFLKREMQWAALLTAVVSFLWMVVIVERTRAQQDEFWAAETT